MDAVVSENPIKKVITTPIKKSNPLKIKSDLDNVEKNIVRTNQKIKDIEQKILQTIDINSAEYKLLIDNLKKNQVKLDELELSWLDLQDQLDNCS